MNSFQIEDGAYHCRDRHMKDATEPKQIKSWKSRNCTRIVLSSIILAAFQMVSGLSQAILGDVAKVAGEGNRKSSIQHSSIDITCAYLSLNLCDNLQSGSRASSVCFEYIGH